MIKKQINKFLFQFSKLIRYVKSDKRIWKEFGKHNSWITKYVINGKTYGGFYDAANDIRLNQFTSAFPVRTKILELGSLEGGHTFCLAKTSGVMEVIGLEGRASNIQKALFIKGLLGNPNVNFIECDLEKDPFSKFGQFDVVFSLGLLYHLTEPWNHLKEVRKASSNLFLWTHFVPDNKSNTEINGYKGWVYKENGLQDPLSGLTMKSFWPTLDGLKAMLNDSGFSRIEIIDTDRHHQDGHCTVTLAARE